MSSTIGMEPYQPDPVLTSADRELVKRAFGNWMEIPEGHKSSLRAWLEQDDTLQLGVGQVYGLDRQLAALQTGLATAGRVSLVTAYPATPADQQEIILTDNIAAPSWWFHLYYVQALTRWLWLGGQPLYARIDTSENGSAASNVWGDFPTVGPSISVPVAGSYMVDFGAAGNGNAAATTSRVGVSINGVAPPAGQTAQAGWNAVASVSNLFQTGALALSTQLKMQELDTDSTRRIGFGSRWMTVTPVALT